MQARFTRGAEVESTVDGSILRIPRGDGSAYRFAQLDDYARLPRGKFPHGSLDLSLVARASGSSLPGTFGFGAWNDPFGISLGFGGNAFRLPAAPNAIWFFYASKENHLTFGDGMPANGFLAQIFRAPSFSFDLAAAAFSLPFSRRVARASLHRAIDEDARVLEADVTQWHRYRLEWKPERSAFWVDDALVFESRLSPRGPLGIVIWIDNQYASFTPDGRLGFGILPGDAAWLEVREVNFHEAEV